MPICSWLIIRHCGGIPNITSEQICCHVSSVNQQKNDHDDIGCLSSKIDQLCSQHAITTIFCNRRREVKAAAQVAKNIPLRIVYFNHLPQDVDTQIKSLSGGIVDVCPLLEKCDLSCKRISLPPFFAAGNYENFKSARSRKEFFLDEFQLRIHNSPLICMIGNFYTNPLYKNHPLLLGAFAKIIHEQKRDAQLVLAGGGDADVKARCYELAQQLNILDKVYFLGSVPEAKIPELLSCIDFHVLPSIKEAFGIVILEAALMKKPSIIAHGTGAAKNFIQDSINGLLFENNNQESLMQKIIYMLDHSDVTVQLGENAYQKVLLEYTSETLLPRLLRFCFKKDNV